jgi:hypothetical protein
MLDFSQWKFKFICFVVDDPWCCPHGQHSITDIHRLTYGFPYANLSAIRPGTHQTHISFVSFWRNSPQ